MKCAAHSLYGWRCCREPGHRGDHRHLYGGVMPVEWDYDAGPDNVPMLDLNASADGSLPADGYKPRVVGRIPFDAPRRRSYDQLLSEFRQKRTV